MDDDIHYLDSDQSMQSSSFGSSVMKVQRSSTLPAIPSADKSDKKNKPRNSRTFHSEERPIVKHPNPYLLKVWKSRSLSRKHEDKKLVFKVDYATPDAVRRMKAVYGPNLFSFFPKTYILPKDYPRLISQYTDMKEWNQCVKSQLKRSARLSPRKSSGNRRDSSLASDSASSSKNGDGKGDWITRTRGRRNGSPFKGRSYTTSNSNSSSGTDKNNNSKTASKNTKSNKNYSRKSNGSKGSRSPNKNGNRGDSSDNNSAKTTSSSNNDSPTNSKKSETKKDLENLKTKKETKSNQETGSGKKTKQGKGEGEGKQNNVKEDKNSEKSSGKKVSIADMKTIAKKGNNKNESNSLQNKIKIDVRPDSGDGGRRKQSSSASSDKRSPQRRGMTWIAKPSSNSQGRGIHIIKDLNDLKFNTSTVVQRYIDNPMLISGYKFDLRLYVIIASFHPLTVYLYREGLVRFATDKFDMNELSNVYAHLTNTSINKGSPSYSDAKDSVGPGCIWALSRLRSYLDNQSTSSRRHPAFTWHKISNIISLTLLTLSNHIPPQAYNCFELLGFDILLDERLKPWLLEVNISPALTTSTYLDAHVKLGVLRHTVFLCEKLFFTESDDQNDDDDDQELTIYKYHRDTAGKKRSRNAIRSYQSEFFQPRVGVFSRSKYQKPIPASLGDLRLIFPFNDETRKATSTEFHDTRTAILEIQKRDAVVQRRLETYSAKKRTNSVNQKIENLLLWCP